MPRKIPLYDVGMAATPAALHTYFTSVTYNNMQAFAGRDGAWILSNHPSMWDIPVQAHGVAQARRRCDWISKKTLPWKSYMVLGKICAIGIDRLQDLPEEERPKTAEEMAQFQSRAEAVYQGAQDLVDAGGLVTIFVEGQRTKDAVTRPRRGILRGLANLRPENPLRVIPMRIDYVGQQEKRVREYRGSVFVQAFGPRVIAPGSAQERAKALGEIVQACVVPSLI